MKKGDIIDIIVDDEPTKAEIIEVLDYQKKKYAVYSLENDDSKTSLMVSLIKKENNEEYLTDLKNKEVKRIILKIVTQALKEEDK